jgi:hypothetical protein
MTDEETKQTSEAQPAKQAKAKPGRPKKKRPDKTNVDREPLRPPLREPLHGGDPDNDIDPVSGFEFTPYEAKSSQHIDHEIIQAIERDYGYSLLWVTTEIAGKPYPEFVISRQRNRFARVKRGNFGGLLDHMCDRDGLVTVLGAVLMGRPMQIEMMARKHDKRMAKHAVEQMKSSHKTDGLAGVTMPEGNSPAALAKNRHRQTFEPFRADDIPES